MGLIEKKIILGTAQFGQIYGVANKKNEIDFNNVKKILHLAFSNKIKFLDTAFSYGKSEKYIGKLNNLNFQIISKIPRIISNEDKIVSEVESFVAQSLKKLQHHEQPQLLAV